MALTVGMNDIKDLSGVNSMDGALGGSNGKYVPFVRRLQRGVEQWHKYSRGLRETRQQLLKHYANAWYGSTILRHAMTINLIDRGVSILMPFLVSQDPNVLVTPRPGFNNPNMSAFAYTLELAMNHLIRELELARDTLRPVVLDSLFCVGITKTGTMHSHNVLLEGKDKQLGTPYCRRIDFDDFICDVAAKTIPEAHYIGHKYRLPKKYIADCGLFKNYDGLKPDVYVLGTGDTSPEYVSRNGKTEFNLNELHPTVELIDLYIPDENIVVTIPPEGQGDKIMRTVEWEGPEGGPFDILGYKWFPGSIVPIPPVYTWLDQNKVVNIMINKMRDMVEREKTVGIFDIADDTDAKVLQAAEHGDIIGLKGGVAGAAKELTFGGFQAQSFPFLQFIMQQWAKAGPNMDIMGGLTTQAGTLGQEQMLQNNALREVDDMQNQAYAFTKSVVRKLAWFLWNDPVKVIPVIKKVGSFDIPAEYSAAAQEGDFADYAFDIEPYSMSRMNPDLRYQRLITMLTQIVLPLAQSAAMQGSQLDVNEVVKEAGRYLGVDTTKWWTTAMPTVENQVAQEMAGGGPGLGAGMADNRFGGGRGQASREADLMQQQSRMGGQFEQTSKQGASKQGASK